jgi:SGT1 protein
MSTSFPILPIQRTSDGDVLEYAVYPVSEVNLQNVLEYALDLMSTWTDNFIWNLDPFSLMLDASMPRLHGTMAMGEDSGIGLDEWIVVALFWKVSQRFPNVAIRFHFDS